MLACGLHKELWASIFSFLRHEDFLLSWNVSKEWFSCFRLNVHYFEAQDHQEVDPKLLFSMFPALRSVSLEKAKFRNSHLSTLVDHLSNLHDLRSLDVFCMPFPPQVFVRLVSLLGQLPALEQLNIGLQPVSKAISEVCFLLEKPNHTLRELNLSVMDDPSAVLEPLADALKRNTSLEVLSLEDNELRSLGSVISRLLAENGGRWRKLNLAKGDLDEVDFLALAPALEECIMLQELRIGANNLGEQGSRVIGEVVAKLPHLRSFSFPNVHVPVDHLLSCARDNTSLRSVEFTCDEFPLSVTAAASLCGLLERESSPLVSLECSLLCDPAPESLVNAFHKQRLTKLVFSGDISFPLVISAVQGSAACLQHLEIISTQVYGDLALSEMTAGLEAVFSASRLTHLPLHTLRIEGIPLPTPLIQGLADWLSNGCCPLQHLSLRECSLRSSHATSLAQALPSNQKLRVLELDRNLIEDEAFLELAHCLRGQTSLERLTMSGNKGAKPGVEALLDTFFKSQTFLSLNVASQVCNTREFKNLCNHVAGRKNKFTAHTLIIM